MLYIRNDSEMDDGCIHDLRRDVPSVYERVFVEYTCVCLDLFLCGYMINLI